MILTDEQIADIHKRATNQFLDPVNLCRAKAFIAELFAELKVVGYIDSDGRLHEEEWSALNPYPLYRNPMQ
jgi:hypothetical protein